MRADDGFLTRWSRRKRSAAARQRDPASPQAPTASVDGEAVAEPPPLPPIESLDATSDIAPFLAPGVPAELTRRALRQAWLTDPAIRGFVGLSENAWDFNAPGGVPGFGPLTAGEIRRLLDALAGKPEAADSPPDPSGSLAAERPPDPSGNATPAVETAAGKAVVAIQDQPDRRKTRAPVSSRRHGSALPQ